MAFSAESDAQIQALTVAQVNVATKKYAEPTKFLNVYAGDFAGAAKKVAASPAEPLKAATAK
jgi:zinc protease